MKLSYRFSLYAGFLIIVIVPFLLAFILFKMLLIDTVENKFYSQAERVGRGINREIRSRSEDLMSLAERYSTDRMIITAVAGGERRLLKNHLSELYKYSNLDLLEVGDTAGHVFMRGHRPAEYGDDKAGQAIIKNALAGEKSADIEYGASGIALRAVAPIISGTGRITGTLMTGILLNKDFFNIYKTITGFNIELYEGETVIASTYRIPVRLSATRFSGKPTLGDQPLRFTSQFDHQEIWGVRIPVYHLHGSLFGSLLLWQDRDTILMPARVNQITLMVASLVATGLALILAVFLSRNFSRPLKRMLPVMDLVSRGVMNIHIPSSRWKEFQEHSKHFKKMVSELQKSRETVVRTQRRLVVAGKLAVLGQVTAELAHEVRNPLNSMEINLRLLKETIRNTPGSDPGLIEKIDRLHFEITRLKETVRDFVEAGGEITLHRTRIDPAREIKSIIELARPQIELLGIKLKSELPKTGALLLDRNRFHQAILNIILNACQAMKPGGTLIIRIAETDEKVSLSIEDDGAGMTPQEKERIFDFPFSSKTAGTGCGLPYVLRIAQAHQGEFNIDSQPGKGTIVTISFPKSTGGEDA